MEESENKDTSTWPKSAEALAAETIEAPAAEAAPQKEPSCAEEGRPSLANNSSASLRRRYSIRGDDNGPYLTCLEAPNVAVRIERGLTVTAAAAKRSPEGTIYLDGAAASEPFMDVQRRVYNLDHHEGCVRPFTLATCEQAMVLVLKGLDLRSGEWTVWANEPDLDTVLSIWVLLNHMRLSEEGSEIRKQVMPLLRLEGAIDANGLRFTELCGFPPELYRATKETLDELYDLEMEVKQTGAWGTVDFVQYTADLLHAVDSLYYHPCLFDEAPVVEEMLRVPITDRRMAVVCRSETGIYEVEKSLSQLHGNNVGLIILQKNLRTYTLRQVDPFLPISLDALYERLNLMDPAADLGGDGNRWGGSAEIGGSPRKTGTRLTPAEIARVCEWVYRPPPTSRRVAATAGVSAAVIGGLALASAGSYIYTESTFAFGATSLIAQTTEWLFGAITSVIAVGLLLSLGVTRRRQFGLRLPRGWRWLLLMPAAVVGGVIGGAWVLPPPVTSGAAALGVALLLPLLSEVIHRGLVQGVLSAYFNVQRPGGRWFLSRPALVSGLLSAAVSSFAFLPQLLGHPQGPGHWVIPLWVLGALVVGFGCAMIRERSGSLLPPALLHLLAALWALWLPSLL